MVRLWSREGSWVQWLSRNVYCIIWLSWKPHAWLRLWSPPPCFIQTQAGQRSDHTERSLHVCFALGLTAVAQSAFGCIITLDCVLTIPIIRRYFAEWYCADILRATVDSCLLKFLIFFIFCVVVHNNLDLYLFMSIFTCIKPLFSINVLTNIKKYILISNMRC